jgi:signal transduction histidine kinase/ActR/RegA family two-component response regulator
MRNYFISIIFVCLISIAGLILAMPSLCLLAFALLLIIAIKCALEADRLPSLFQLNKNVDKGSKFDSFFFLKNLASQLNRKQRESAEIIAQLKSEREEKLEEIAKLSQAKYQLSSSELKIQDFSSQIRDHFLKMLKKVSGATHLYLLENDSLNANQSDVSERLKGKITQFASKLSSNKEALLINHFRVLDWREDLSPFGIYYSYFERQEIAQDRKITLWLGFPSSRAPDHNMIKSINALFERFIEELKAGEKIISVEEELKGAKRDTSGKNIAIAQLSHDMRSPISNLKSILSVLRFDLRDQNNRELLEAGFRSCDCVAAMVDDLLDYTRHHSGELHAELQLLNLSLELSLAAEDFKTSIRMKGLNYSCEIEEGCWIDGDLIQLRRVISNLASNAIKFTQSGEVSFSLKKGACQESILTIKDTGCGISQNNQLKLFTPFAKLNDERIHDKVTSIGLGLSVTKLLVEANKGKIEVESKEDLGSIFRVTFPAASSVKQSQNLSENLATSFSIEKPSTINQLKGKKLVLLVDDDSDHSLSLGKVLELEKDLTIISAATLAEANLKLSRFKPSAIISDLKIGDENSLDLINLAICNQVPDIAILSGLNLESLKELIPKEIQKKIKFYQKPANVLELIAWLKNQENDLTTDKKTAKSRRKKTLAKQTAKAA